VIRLIVLRLLRSIAIIAAIAALNFVIVHLAPGDVAEVMAGESGAASPEYVAELKQRFGLDQPMHVQFLVYLTRIAQLDLGYSFRFGTSVASLIFDRLPATLLLMIPSLILAFATGAALGVLASRKVGSWSDAAISITALVFYATPIFWISLMMIILFGVKLGWLPTGGMESVGANLTGFAKAANIAWHMVLPVLTLSLFYIAYYARLMRASMLEVFGQDFVATARAKGLSETRVAFHHVLRNALLPVVTVLGLQVANLLGGTILVETVFAWPGLGRLAYESVASRDINLLLGILLLSSVMVVATNIVVETVYRRLDPRIRAA
jgi:peptide/nickel transport system permease protein